MGGVMTLAALINYMMTASIVGLAAVVVAAENSLGSDPFTWLINLGVAGIVIVLLITGQLRTKAEVEHLLLEIAKKDEVIDAVQRQLLEQTLPALAKSTRVIEQVPDVERSLFTELQRAQVETQRLLQEIVEQNRNRR